MAGIQFSTKNDALERQSTTRLLDFLGDNDAKITLKKKPEIMRVRVKVGEQKLDQGARRKYAIDNVAAAPGGQVPLIILGLKITPKYGSYMAGIQFLTKNDALERHITTRLPDSFGENDAKNP